uniref:Uncharacterized protein n=1 Tax=Dunaliella tertiolecta TaxID=3047 RepID=A0A7S3QK50_DUNTE
MCSLQVPLPAPSCSSLRTRNVSTRGRVGYLRMAPASSRCQHREQPRQVAAFGLFDSIKQNFGAGEGISSTSSNSYAAVDKMDYYDKDEVLLYFDYIGLLATEGSYDMMNELLEIHSPGNVILLLAARENDAPKVSR